MRNIGQVCDKDIVRVYGDPADQNPNKVSNLQSKLSHAAKQSLDRKFGTLYDKVYREDVIQEAWKRVLANRGAPGVDKQDFEYIEDVIGVEIFLAEIRDELKSGRYRPLPVLRCYIDKLGKPEKRPLGIPAIVDRVVQNSRRISLIAHMDFGLGEAPKMLSV